MLYGLVRPAPAGYSQTVCLRRMESRMSSFLRPAARALVGVTAVAVCMALAAPSAVATHVQCGDTLTEDTTLDSDLIDCPGKGIMLGADEIVLDLNGHTIDGVSTSSLHGARGVIGHGPYPSRLDGVTIENGSIRQFSAGVELDYAADGLIHGLVISDTGSGIYVNQSHGMRIARNSIRGFGMHVSGSLGTVIERNSVAGGGIGITGGAHALVVRNSISESPNYGLQVVDASDHAVIRNLVTRNRVGISAVDSAYYTRVERNSVHANLEDGILVDCCESAVIGNLANANGDDGIEVTFGGSEEFGPDEVTRNTANHNGGLGIKSLPGVIDGGGNRAFGNGNPLQCLNVSCR